MIIFNLDKPLLYECCICFVTVTHFQGLRSGKPDLQGSFICNVVTCITLLCVLQCLICLNAGETGYFFKNNVLIR